MESSATLCPGGGSPPNLDCLSSAPSTCPDTNYSDRYDDASAVWVVVCAMLMFFMKAGFLYVEEAFSLSEPRFRRRVVLAKYVDIFGSTLGFWFFGYAISGNTTRTILGEEQDYIFWFFRFTFASNTATIIGGTLVGSSVQMRVYAVFVYSFLMTSFIHPVLARFFWSSGPQPPPFASPYRYCNGSYIFDVNHTFTVVPESEQLGQYVFIDFAGSGLVHVCGGMAGFVLACFHKLETSEKARSVLQDWFRPLRRQKSRQSSDGVEEGENRRIVEGKSVVWRFLEWMYPSGGGEENVESAALGILILWVTWFAFNCGSTESISGKPNHAAVGRIALVMCLAAASGGVVQVIVSAMVQLYKRDENYNTNEIANAVLACLVAVTGCCPFIDAYFAILIGVLTVVFYHLGCMLEFALGIHDGARVFPVHAVCGFWGVLCVGLFSRGCLIQELYEGLCFCCSNQLPETVHNQGLLIGYQLAGALLIMFWSLTFCSIIFFVLWVFPIKAIMYAFGLKWILRFNDEVRGEIKFEGNILFTHFGEIHAPIRRQTLTDDSYALQTVSAVNVTPRSSNDD